jgi:glycosyltransferase involved in cell wall biosynthesis
LIAVYSHPETFQGIEIIPLPRFRRALRPLLWGKVVRLALSTKASIFQFEDPELLFISPIIRLLSGRPVIYDVLESTADFIEIKEDIPKIIRHFLAWTFHWLEPFLARLQSGLIFADDQIANTFQYVQCPKTTLFNFPEQSFLDVASEATKNPRPRHLMVLYLGGLKRARGTAIILETFQQILSTVPNAKLFLVGPFAPASLEKEIRSEIERRKMSSAVIITGAVPFSKVGEYLSQASVGWIPFLPIPKYQKNIPTKLFEYMAYAVPVVSSDLRSVHPFIQNRKTGILVSADNPSAHAKAIIELLNDHKWAEQLGNNGQIEVLNHYRWSEMENRLYEFYQLVLTQI